MTLYSTASCNATVPEPVQGRHIAHAKLTRGQQNAFASAWHDGRIEVARPTIAQAAAVFGTSAGAVFASRRHRETSHDSKIIALSCSIDAVTIAPTDADIDAFIKRAGIDRTWHRMSAMIS